MTIKQFALLLSATFLPCSWGEYCENTILAQKQVHILSVNDMHANIDNMPKLAAVADSLRSLYPELIILSGGDNRTGNPYNDRNAEPSRPMTELMNAIGFNASAIGNHEFDANIEGLRTQINRSRFPYLCANVFLPDTMRTHVYPYRFIDANGVRIGLLGGIQINSANIPDCHIDRIKGVTFRNIDDVIPDYEWMRSQCDIFILLSHNGYLADSITAMKYPFLDAIIGGHSHTKIDGAKYHNGVMVTQAKNKVQFATLSTFEVNEGKVTAKSARLINVGTNSSENKEVKALVETFQDSPVLRQALTQVASPFNTKEELGNMEMDALIAETGADIAIQNGGGVRYDTHDVGPFTVYDLLALDPFGNNAIIYEMTGKEVADFIMNDFDVDEKQIPIVGGIRYVMKIDKETKHPKSIKIELLDGNKFSEKATYKMVTNSYAKSISTSPKTDQGTDLQMPCSDYVERWLRKQQSLNYTDSSRAKVIIE